MRLSVKSLTTSSVLTSLAVMVEVLGGLLPGIGIFISGFSTLFVAIAGSLNLVGGLLTYLISTLLIGLMLPAKVPLFFLSRGLLGLVMGVTYSYGKKISVPASGLSLTFGTLLLSFFLGFPLPGFTQYPAWWPLSILVLTVYSLFFSWVWAIFLTRVKNLIARHII